MDLRPDNHDAEVYHALMSKDKEKVLQLCQPSQGEGEGPFNTVTIHNDTVLHVALYSMQVELVTDLLKLVKDLPQDELIRKMKYTNSAGNTILHEAATYNKLVQAAIDILNTTPNLAPDMLSMRNNYGETASFRAARYGQLKMFKRLDQEAKKQCTGEIGKDQFYHYYYQKKGKRSTILHAVIVAEHFDVAFFIATNYSFLVDKEDDDGMTALQLLACKASAFKSRDSSGLKHLIYSCVTTKDSSNAKEEGCRIPWLEAVRKEKQRYESALKLAKFLIEKDTSWKATFPVDEQEGKTHEYGEETSSAASPGKEVKKVEEPLTPLFLATKSGCVEIVKEILHVYPQAVEHIDYKGRTILHMAIMYRQIEIFNLVEEMELPMRRLIRKCDKEKNSILHMVGQNGVDRVAEDAMQTPALQLREDLLLFERVKDICSTNFFNHINSKKQTADNLFATKCDGLRTKAKEWLKSTAENCTIVAVLIATVAFAAAYTIPGGSNQNTGVPILLNQSFFVIFTVADVLSLAFTLTSVIIFLSILTSPFRLKDFKQSLPQQLMLGVTFLIFSVSMMMLAFAATIILMIRNKEQWTKIALYTVAFLPVTIFAISYLPLYSSLMKTLKYPLKKIKEVCPLFSCVPVLSWIANLFDFRKSQTTTGSTCPPVSQTTHSPV